MPTTRKTAIDRAIETAKEKAEVKCRSFLQSTEDQIMGGIQSRLDKLEGACRQGVKNLADELKTTTLRSKK